MTVPMGWTAISDIWSEMLRGLAAECGPEHDALRNKLLRAGITTAQRFYHQMDKSGMTTALMAAQTALEKQIGESVTGKKLCVHTGGELGSVTLREWGTLGRIYWPEGRAPKLGSGLLVLEDKEAKRLQRRVTDPRWLRGLLDDVQLKRADRLDECAKENRSLGGEGNLALANKNEAESLALRERAHQTDEVQDKGGRPKHPAHAWYAKRGFLREGMSMKNLQRAMPKDDRGNPPSPSTIRAWEKHRRKAD